MKLKYKAFRLIVVLNFFVATIHAQQAEVTLAAPDAGNKTHVARDRVKYLPGYTYKGQPGMSMRGYTDKYMVVSASYGGMFSSSDFTKVIDTQKEVGFTPGAPGVSPSGGATYSVPIQLPSGTNGMMPSLAVSYNSQGGSGLLGMGWNISGLSSISRVPKTYYHNQITEPIKLDVSDNFSMDGNRLIATGVAAEYLTEIETFSKITSYGVSGTGPLWFEVLTKDGKTIQFGNSDDSRLLQENGSTVIYWMISKISDAYGNYMAFKYKNENREIRIDKILYTGNSTAGLLPYNTVQFYYESRNDKSEVYLAGSSLRSSYLLNKIEIVADGERFKEYEFLYGQDTNDPLKQDQYSFLKELKEFGAGREELNSSIFKYGEKGVPFQSSAISSYSNAEIVSARDFNGDGKGDIILNHFVYNQGIRTYTSWEAMVSSGNNQFSHYATGTIPSGWNHYDPVKSSIPLSGTNRIFDFNGDGQEDILLFNYHQEGSTFWINNIKVVTINGYDNTTEQDIFSAAPGYAGNIAIPGKDVFTGDFDGDGKDDVLLISRGQFEANYKVILFSSSGTSYTQRTVAFSSINYIPTSHSVYTVDINGDGKQELMTIFASDICEIFEISGYNTQLFGTTIYKTGFPTTWHKDILPGDFNGDGKTDLLTRGSSSDPWYINYSNGKIFVGATFTFNRYVDKNNDKLKVGDYNGDGKADILHGYTSKVDVYFSAGTNAFQYQSNPYSGLLGGGALISGDFNGDGKTDEINIESIYAANIFSFNKDGTNLLLNKVTNGFNQTITFNHSYLSKGTNYTKGTGAVFPVIEFAQAIPVVASMVAPDGIGGNNTTTYFYEGAKAHRQGKGFLGFQKVTVQNTTSGSKAVSESELNSTYGLLLVKKQSSYLLSDNSLVSEVTNTNVVKTLGGLRIWPFVSSTTAIDKLNTFTSTVSYLYDDFGNPTSVVTNKGIETTTTNSTYEKKYSWIPSSLTSLISSTTRTGQPAYSKTTHFTYFNNGGLEQQIDFPGAAKSVSTKYTYNILGNVVSTVIQPAGLSSIKTSYIYNSKGRFVVKTTNPLLQTQTVINDNKWGKPLSVTGIDGLTTTFEYDGFGRLTKTTDPKGVTVTTTSAWDIKSGGGTATSAGSTLFYTYAQHPGRPDVKEWFDGLGRSVQTETEGFAKNIRAVKTYDTKGNLKTETTPFFSGGEDVPVVTSFTYDSYNRLKTRQNTAATTTYNYSATNGEATVSVTSPTGNTSTTTDATGKTVKATDAGGTLIYTWLSSGNQQKITLNGTEVALMEYDGYGNQTKLIDKNAGTTSYDYDALGRLISQTDANSKTYTMEYDIMGRTTTCTGPDGTTTSEYITSGPGLNLLKKVTGPNNVFYEYTYDGYSRLIKEKKVIDPEQLVTEYAYDKYDNLIVQTYPSGFKLQKNYNPNGYLTSITNGSSVTVFGAPKLNAFGQYTEYKLGNGVTTTKQYDTYGFPRETRAAAFHWVYSEFNPANGNLNLRFNGSATRVERFKYDALNRLTEATSDKYSPFKISYGANGNITTKADAGSYTYYDNTKINAVKKIDNPHAAISSVEQIINYTTFDRTESIIEGNYDLKLTYGPDYNRIKSVLKNGDTTKTKYYDADYEKEIVGSDTYQLHYISGGDGLNAIYVIENGVGRFYYIYTDHLGSILTVTNATGQVVETRDFDAWGRNRNPYDLTYSDLPASNLKWLSRGFTGHEHLPEFGLINMNNRMYDPIVGRMLAVDNFVQDPFSTQAYNRYGYVLNNPLKYTDPDGEAVHILIGAIIGGAVNLGIKAYQGKINGWGDGFAAFGIGAAAGAIGAATGGAAFIAAGGGGAGAGGFAAGAIGGMVGAAMSLPVQSIGNSVYFGDPFMTPKEYGIGILAGGVFWGAINGGIAFYHGRSFLTGSLPREAITPMPTKSILAIQNETRAEIQTHPSQELPNQRTLYRIDGTDGIKYSSRIPCGTRTNYLNTLGNNETAIINGRTFSGHALDQMQGRGILSPSLVEDAIINTSQIINGNTANTFVHIGQNGLRVVINGYGNVITVY